MATFCSPAYEYVPPHVGTYGPEVADLADAAGMTLDPEQRLVLDAMYAHDARGRLVAPEFGCAAPRQNVKSHVGKAAALADLYLFKVPNCLWTAHLRETADDIFTNQDGNGLAQIFESYDFLRRTLDGEPRNSDGEVSITLRPSKAGAPRPKLRFKARSRRSARGLSGMRVTYDEALYLQPEMTSAMTPILSARSIGGQVQVRYLGSAGLLHSAVWRGIRDRGRAKNALRLAWIEWLARHVKCEDEHCAHAPRTPGCALDRADLVREANLAADRRMDVEGFILGVEREQLLPIDYMTERLGWWQDPPNADGGDLDMARWGTLADIGATPRRPLVVGVDQGEDRTVSIGCAWRRPDADVQVMLGQDEDEDGALRVDVGLSPGAAVARIGALRKRHGARVLLGGPALGSLGPALTEAGVPIETVTSSEFATACGQVEDRMRAGTIHHGGQPKLTDSVAVAKWRSVGKAGEREFQLAGVPGIGPAAAVVRALHGVLSRPVSSMTGPVAFGDGVAPALFPSSLSTLDV
jgi:hypothetical protein